MMTPAQQLAWACLENCYHRLCEAAAASTSVNGKRALEEEVAWINVDDSHWPYSFLNICQGLNLDVEWVRSGLLSVLTQPQPQRIGPTGELLPIGITWDARRGLFSWSFWDGRRRHYYDYATVEAAEEGYIHYHKQQKEKAA